MEARQGLRNPFARAAKVPVYRNAMRKPDRNDEIFTLESGIPGCRRRSLREIGLLRGHVNAFRLCPKHAGSGKMGAWQRRFGTLSLVAKPSRSHGKFSERTLGSRPYREYPTVRFMIPEVRTTRPCLRNATPGTVPNLVGDIHSWLFRPSGAC